MIHATRSRDLTIVGSLPKPNAALSWITAGTLAALGASIYVRPVSEIFRFAPLGLRDVAIAVVAGFAGVILYDFYKWLRPRRV